MTRRTKEVSINLDFEELDKQIEEQRAREQPEEQNSLNVRSTVFTLGKDPRLGTKKQVQAPDLQLLELLKDGVDNPYVELSWRTSRFDVDSGGIVAFNVYRRKLTREEIFKENRDFKKKIRTFSRTAFDRVSRKITKKGKFSCDKKGLYQMRRSLIPQDILNFQAHSLEGQARSKTDFLQPHDTRSGLGPRSKPRFSFQPQYFGRSEKGEFERAIFAKKFKVVGTVSYSQFLKKDQQKFVSVTEREFVDILYQDKEVGYGEVFEYYITSVSEDAKETHRSNVVRILVEDMTSIRPPITFTATQGTENSINLRICLDPRDDIGRVLLYRKSEDEINFKRAGAFTNISDCVSLKDVSVVFGKSYTYRVFAENIHGTLSEPIEIEVPSTVQRITPQSRSNNLKIPILTTVQDQNSDFIKITMSSNDIRVHYYELERRDMTIHEKKFTKPSKLFTGFGGIAGQDGWVSNKFFVNRDSDPILLGETELKSLDYFNQVAKEKEIIFVDNTVESNHIYQYRVRGFDLFGNASPYKLSLIRATGKKSIRSPINTRFQILRGSPLRVKVLWDDDNLSTEFSASEIFEGDQETLREPAKVIYKIQRRRRNEIVHQSFPLTANQYVIDETPAPDAITFSAKRQEDIFTNEENIESDEEFSNVFVRAFGVPEFLSENDIYYYRIAAVADNGDVSNFTEEVEFSTLPELSAPINIKTEVLNSRVRPLVGKLTWGVEFDKSHPDRWIIERKFDTDNDTFEVIGQAYINPEFFDKDLEVSNTYVYRIKSVDLIGRESIYFEARLTV